MPSPTLIISFDCEGKWGNADRLTEHHERLHTNNNLIMVYRNILKVLERYDIDATFAFVGALTLSIDEFNENRDWFHDVDIKGNNWLKKFRSDSSVGDFDGWFNPGLVDLVRNNGAHEVATHGFTHLPLHESLIHREDFHNEMSAVRELGKMKGLNFSTLVYPRNLCGFKSKLLRYGIDGYREDIHNGMYNKFTRVKNIAREFNALEKAQTVTEVSSERAVRIPSGYFLNWRSSIRQFVPISVTVKRWRSIINNAVKYNKIVHLWAHPHNFIDGKNQLSLLEIIIRIAVKEISRGNLVNLTQAEFCREARKQQYVMQEVSE